MGRPMARAGVGMCGMKTLRNLSSIACSPTPVLLTVIETAEVSESLEGANGVSRVQPLMPRQTPAGYREYDSIYYR